MIINEDHQTPTIFGNIVVRAGSVDDPADATGLAHYLEHVMFKGSSNLGTTNWEEEKVHYDKIISLYDQLREVAPTEREAIQKQINEESILAGKYIINNEYSNMIQSMGGTSLNASTGYEMTQYFNVFPSNQLKKWLELNLDRFMNPVYRGFQAELETVYEEKNMYSDNPFSVLSEEYAKNIYGVSSLYSRPIIGETEHLKTPSLRKLIEFYKKYYVPSNMAIVLSGDINVEEVKPLLESTFGTWNDTSKPVKQPIGKSDLKAKSVVKLKVTPIPVLMLGYKGPAVSHDDGDILEVVSLILSNRNKTGLMDKLVIDNELMQVQVSLDLNKHDGSIQVIGIPSFDVGQMRFTSLSTVEKLLVSVLDDLKKGNFEDWLVQSAKDNLLMNYEMSKESNLSVGMQLSRLFANEIPLEEFDKYASKINGITKEQLQSIAQKYFVSSYLSLQSDKGKPSKDALPKPDYKPVETAKGQTSAFAREWMKQPVLEASVNLIDFNKDVNKSELVPGVTLFHTQNSANDIFTMTIKYGVGTGVIPNLGFSTQLMNMAGVLALHTPYELKREFAKLGCVVNFSADKSYTYVHMQGKEASLAKACQLLTKLCLMPALDEKQMNSLLGNELSSRSIENEDKDTQGDAMSEYIRYGKNSSFINRVSQSEMREFTVSSLAAEFIKATQFETSVHYTGRFDAGVIKNVLLKNLAFPSSLTPSQSPYVTPLMDYKENTVLLLNNRDARQSDVYIYVGGETYDLSQSCNIDAFNEYFGGGFNGVVLQELRELRSFAYTASSSYSTPAMPGTKSFLNGYIGVQSDKTNDAVGEFIRLIQDMPQHPERMENIRQYLYMATLSTAPSLRAKSRLVERWMQLGYKEDPRKEWLAGYQKLQYTDIMEFYQKNIQKRPVVIGIVGNTKALDQNKLKSIGKIVNTGNKELFKN